MRKTAVKRTLSGIASIAAKTIFLYLCATFFFVLLFLVSKAPHYDKLGNRDDRKFDSVVITATIARDGSVLLEKDITYPDKTREKNSHTDYSLIKIKSDGSLAFEYESPLSEGAGYYGLSVRMEGEDLSKVVKEASSGEFNGTAGFKDGEYVAFTIWGLERDERFRVNLLLSGEYFGILDSRINPSQYLIGNISRTEKAVSLTAHALRQADKYLFFALAAALVLLFAVPLLSRKSTAVPDINEPAARLSFLRGMQKYTRLMLLCESALLVSYVFNPFEFRISTYFIFTLLFGIIYFTYLICPTNLTLSFVRIAIKETARPRDANGYIPEISALNEMPTASAGRTVLHYTQENQANRSTFFYSAVCQEDYYSLYRCPECGKINLQLLTSRIEMNSVSEERSAKKLRKLVPSVSEALMGTYADDFWLCLKANIQTECLACNKTPYWAVKNDKTKAINKTVFIVWAILTVLYFATSGKPIPDRHDPRILLAFVLLSIALLLSKPLITLAHVLKKLVSKYPSPRLFAGSIEELSKKAQTNSNFKDLKLKSAKEDYGDKWIKTETCSGTLVESEE